MADICQRSPVCNGRAQGHIVDSDSLHDRSDHVHDELWLVNRDNMTGLFSDDQTSCL